MYQKTEKYVTLVFLVWWTCWCSSHHGPILTPSGVDVASHKSKLSVTVA